MGRTGVIPLQAKGPVQKFHQTLCLLEAMLKSHGLLLSWSANLRSKAWPLEIPNISAVLQIRPFPNTSTIEFRYPKPRRDSDVSRIEISCSRKCNSMSASAGSVLARGAALAAPSVA